MKRREEAVAFRTVGFQLETVLKFFFFYVDYRRNQNFLDILNGLNLGQKGVFGITHQFHHVFWFGDLNYRIDLEVKVRNLSHNTVQN